MAMFYKIPTEFVAEHRATLDAWDWTKPLNLAATFPQHAFIEGDALAVLRAGVVASVHPGTMVRMRRAAETLPQLPKPTIEQTAAVLAARNPSTPT